MTASSAYPHSHEGEPYVAVRQHLEGEAVMRRTVRMRFCPRGWLGARERDDLQGLREGDVRENVPLVPGARARARVLGVPVVAGLRVRRVRARRTAGDDHPVGGAAHRRDLVRRAVLDSHHVSVSRHPREVAARRSVVPEPSMYPECQEQRAPDRRSLGRGVAPPLGPAAPIGELASLAPAPLRGTGRARVAVVHPAAA